ncbi:MAG: type II toxin-antitoxin system RelE/ParE family toxin [Thermodesulfobacteriota bacterium]
MKGLFILREIGPSLGRPWVDSIQKSRHQNMKELRVQNKQRLFRIFFAFDPRKEVILLIGGDKRGDKRFFQKMIPLADRLYDKHLEKFED